MESDPYVRNIDFSRLPEISVDEIAIPYVDEAYNLGIMLTSNLGISCSTYLPQSPFFNS